MTKEFLQFCTLVYREIERADAKYGDWQDMLVIACMNVVEDETMELYEAVINEDIHGQHGIIAEAIQVSATAYKLIRRVTPKGE